MLGHTGGEARGGHQVSCPVTFTPLPQDGLTHCPGVKLVASKPQRVSCLLQTPHRAESAPGVFSVGVEDLNSGPQPCTAITVSSLAVLLQTESQLSF